MFALSEFSGDMDFKDTCMTALSIPAFEVKVGVWNFTFLKHLNNH